MRGVFPGHLLYAALSLYKPNFNPRLDSGIAVKLSAAIKC